MARLDYSCPCTMGVIEVEHGVRPIEGASTAVAGFIGFTEDIRGGAELFKPMLVSNWAQYLAYFASPNSSGFTDFNAYLPFAVYGYFLNGGSRCWITSIGTQLPEKLPAQSQPIKTELPSALEIPKRGNRPCSNLLLRPDKAPDGPKLAQEVEGDRHERTGIRGIFDIDEITMVAFPDLMRAYEAKILDLEQVHSIMETMVSMAEGTLDGGMPLGPMVSC